MMAALPNFAPLATALQPGEMALWLELSLGIAIALLAGRVYGRLWRAARARFKALPLTHASPFGFPDLLACLVLFTWLGNAAYHGFSAPPRRLTDTSIVEGGLVFAVIVSGLLLFLHARGGSILETFGLKPAAPWALLKRAAGLFVTALPLVYLAFALVTLLSGDETQSQDITQYFQDAATASDWYRVGLVMTLAMFVAPVTEELLFRGYFYGVLKQYVGVTPALVATSLLFAAVHLNGAVFLPLFVLAACLTLAYEATGSLLTSMVMHALFNTTMLAAMFYTARHP